jgi:hypothetical protein
VSEKREPSEEKEVVKEKGQSTEVTREQTDASQAERMPPAAPMASRTAYDEYFARALARPRVVFYEVSEV